MQTRLKLLMEKLNLNQSRFAKQLGFNRSYISRIINDAQLINDRFIRAVCKEFHVSEEWLRTGEGEMFLPSKQTEKKDDVFAVEEKTVDEFVEAASKLPKELQDVLIKIGLALCEKREIPPLGTLFNGGTRDGNSKTNNDEQ